MTVTDETVADRVETLKTRLTPLQAASLIVFGTAITFMLVVLQDPLVHDSTHNFRHAVGIACH